MFPLSLLSFAAGNEIASTRNLFLQSSQEALKSHLQWELFQY